MAWFGDVEIGAGFDLPQGPYGQFVEGGNRVIKGLGGKSAQLVEAFLEFFGCLVGEGDDSHFSGKDSKFEQKGDQGSDDPAFPRTGEIFFSRKEPYFPGKNAFCLEM